MMCQLPVEVIASYSGHILSMEHADHRDSASPMRHALRNFCTLVYVFYLAQITSWDKYEHSSLLDKDVKVQLQSQVS